MVTTHNRRVCRRRRRSPDRGTSCASPHTRLAACAAYMLNTPTYFKSPLRRPGVKRTTMNTNGRNVKVTPIPKSAKHTCRGIGGHVGKYRSSPGLRTRYASDILRLFLLLVRPCLTSTIRHKGYTPAIDTRACRRIDLAPACETRYLSGWCVVRTVFVELAAPATLCTGIAQTGHLLF